ncbi:MAG: metal ABC transporter permease [Planctomycetes bacterium]|jgi:zinc transport system permease protein|nr:metal ABC transporter permease [Planctomycetota bacterium]MCL4729451.1 metal ABC transporter permease [Planctomycetota bacterium]
MTEFAAYYLGGSGTAVLAGVLLVSLASGVLSPIVVANRMAFFSDAVAHSSLAGVVLGMLLGLGHPVLSMAAFGVMVSLVIASLRQRSPLALDTLLGVAMAGSLAVGLVLYHYVRGYSDLHSYLLGQVSLLGWADAAILGANAAIAVVLVALFANRLTLVAVSRNLAQARGVAVARYEYLLIVMLGLVVSLSVRAVGILMVNALLVVPAATARHVARSFAGLFWASIGVSLAAGVTGLLVGDVLNLPTAPAIVSAGVLLFALAWGLGRLRGTEA